MTEIALLFPGQGSHEEGMEEAYAGSSLLERGLDLLDYDPFARLADGTRYQQPALFLCGVAAWEMARPAERRRGRRPLPRRVRGARRRRGAALRGRPRAGRRAGGRDGRRPASACAGGMVAVLGGDPADVAALAAELGLVVANDNAPGQLVLAGPRARPSTAPRARARDLGARAAPASGQRGLPLAR